MSRQAALGAIGRLHSAATAKFVRRTSLSGPQPDRGTVLVPGRFHNEQPDLRHIVTKHHFEHCQPRVSAEDLRPLRRSAGMTEGRTFEHRYEEITSSALRDFASAEMSTGSACDFGKVRVDITRAPHHPKGLPIGRMAVYCFFFHGQSTQDRIGGAQQRRAVSIAPLQRWQGHEHARRVHIEAPGESRVEVDPSSLSGRLA